MTRRYRALPLISGLQLASGLAPPRTPPGPYGTHWGDSRAESQGFCSYKVRVVSWLLAALLAGLGAPKPEGGPSSMLWGPRGTPSPRSGSGLPKPPFQRARLPGLCQVEPCARPPGSHQRPRHAVGRGPRAGSRAARWREEALSGARGGGAAVRLEMPAQV